MKNQTTHYRYERDYNDVFAEETCIKLVEFETRKETQYGYWIYKKGYKNYSTRDKFVLKKSKKRYAYPSKEEALLNFKTRTEMSKRLAKLNLKSADKFLKILEKFEIT